MSKNCGRKVLYVIIYKNGEHGKPHSFYMNCEHKHDATRMFRKVNSSNGTRILYIQRAEVTK